MFLLLLVSRSSFYRFLNRNFDAFDFQIKVFAGKVLQQTFFLWKSFLMDFGIVFCDLLEVLGAVFLNFLGLENRLENRRILVM